MNADFFLLKHPMKESESNLTCWIKFLKILSYSPRPSNEDGYETYE